MDLFCKKYLKVAYANTGPKKAVFTRLRCKQWSCDYCARKNASIWRAHLIQRLPEVSSEWWLLTLTASSLIRDELGSLANIRDHIDRLFKRVNRVWENVEYVRIFERHPTSLAIHAHLIVCGLTPFVEITRSVKNKRTAKGVNTRKGRKGTWSSKTWFKKNAQECKMGYIVDLRVIEGDVNRAIGYVMKYATKAQQDLHVRYLRHIIATKGIGGVKNEPQEGWQTAAYITTYTFEPGTHVEDLNTGFVIDNNYWEVKGFYPDDSPIDTASH